MTKENLAAANAIAAQIAACEGQIKALERIKEQQYPPFTESEPKLGFALSIGGVCITPDNREYITDEDVEEIAGHIYNLWLKVLRDRLKDLNREFRNF